MSIDHTSIATGPTPRKGKKYFSVDEANRSLPYVSRVVSDISETYRLAVETRQRIEHPHREDSIESLKDEYETFMDRLNDLIDELHQVGVELKGAKSTSAGTAVKRISASGTKSMLASAAGRTLVCLTLKLPERKATRLTFQHSMPFESRDV